MSIRDLVPSIQVKRGNGNRSPFLPIESLKDEMDQLFESFSPRSILPTYGLRTSQALNTVALADISETDKEIEVVMDLPGLEEKNIDVTFRDNQLFVEGKRDEEHVEEGRDYHRMERSFGSFRRSFYLPAEIEENKVQAKFKKGVLTITLPKSTAALKSQKKIKVQSD